MRRKYAIKNINVFRKSTIKSDICETKKIDVDLNRFAKNIQNNEKNNLANKVSIYEKYNLNYEIKYAVLNSKNIINLCDPCLTYNLEKIEEGAIEFVRRNYIKYIDQHTNFFSKLEKSILEEGILNPILVTGGYPRFRNISEIPHKYRNIQEENMLVCEILGGSRLYIAQKNNLFIPAIVSDFNNVVKYAKVLCYEHEIFELFKTKPECVEFTQKGLKMSTLDHFFIEHSKEYINSFRIKFIQEELNNVLQKYNMFKNRKQVF